MTDGYVPSRTFEVAAQVSRILSGMGVVHAVIGSVALAVHGFVRATRDLDMGVLVLPSPQLVTIAERLRAEGLTVEVSPPAPDDELGGVLTVTGTDFDPIQVVNFFNPPRGASALVREALATASTPVGFPLQVVDLPHLVALKLATGAFRDEVDVGDLLEAQAEVPEESVREVCARHGLDAALDRVVGRLVPRG